MQCVCAATEDSEGVVDEIRLPPEQAGWDREQERGLEESGPSKAPHPSGWSRGGSERELGKQPGQFVKGKARAQDV